MFKDKLTGMLGNAKDKASAMVEKAATASQPYASEFAEGTQEAVQMLKDMAPDLAQDAIMAKLRGGSATQAIQDKLEEAKAAKREEFAQGVQQAMAVAMQEYNEQMQVASIDETEPEEGLAGA